MRSRAAKRRSHVANVISVLGFFVWLPAACGLEHLYSGRDAVDVVDGGTGDGSPLLSDTGGGEASARPPGDDAASSGCDPSKPWILPVPIAALNFLSPASGARLSPDELTVYFNAGAPPRIFTATRTSREATFDRPELLAMQDGQDAAGFNLGAPTVTPDERTIYFERSGGGVAEIDFATRPSKKDAFGARAVVAGLVGGGNTSQPYVRGDGSEIYFVSRRAPAQAGSPDVFRAKLTGPGVAEQVAHVTELGSNTDERTVLVTADGLALYVSTLRTTDGGAGAVHRIWRARRASASDPFGTPTLVEELQSAANDYPSWISPDGCTMYLASTRGGATQIFVTVHPPRAPGSADAQPP